MHMAATLERVFPGNTPRAGRVLPFLRDPSASDACGDDPIIARHRWIRPPAGEAQSRHSGRVSTALRRGESDSPRSARLPREGEPHNSTGEMRARASKQESHRAACPPSARPADLQESNDFTGRAVPTHPLRSRPADPSPVADTESSDKRRCQRSHHSIQPGVIVTLGEALGVPRSS